MRCLLLLIPALLLAEPKDSWLQLVSPIVTSAERSRYLAMTPAEQVGFREHFFEDKSVTAADYATRVEYIDSVFGSGKRGSGANTDQGRAYLSLGAPNRVTRLASSRSFVPLEIWYYASAPQVGAPSELRLVFYRKNTTGIPKLYSPVLGTIRELLLPQPSIRGMFGPNESADTNVIRQRLGARPVENEVIEAATSVSPGVQNSENDQILLRVMSPEAVLRQNHLRAQVRSRLLNRARNLTVITSASSLGGSGLQIDLLWRTEAARQIRVEVTDASGSVYNNNLALNFDRPKSLDYLHRLDLLPGRYTLLLTADGNPAAYPLNIDAQPVIGSLLRANVERRSDRQTPLQFAGQQIEIAADGASLVLPVPAGQQVEWAIRDGWRTLSKQQTISDGLAMLALPSTGLPPRYQVEANVGGVSRTFEVAPDSSNRDTAPPTISFNANLSESDRLNFIGRQWTRRGDVAQARAAFQSSLRHAETAEAVIGIARLDAAEGRVDQARSQVRKILSGQPRNFEALTTMAFLEAQLQDYPVAADYFRRALDQQDAPAIRRALADLPK